MIKQKKVLIIANNNLGRGGVQSAIMSIVRNLHTYYIFDIVVFGQAESYYETEFLSYGGKIFRCPRYEHNNRIIRRLDLYTRGDRYYRFAKKIMKENNYYAVHCNNNFEAAPFVKAAKECGIKVRIVQNHIIIGQSDLFTRLLRKHYLCQIMKCSTNRIGCSEEACKTMFGSASTAQVIHNAFDSKRFDRTVYTEDKQRDINIIQIGNFSDLKNQLFTIDVIACIKRKYPNVICNLVGFDVDGYEAVLRQQIDKKGLIYNVSLWPSDADTPRLLSMATGLMQPSKTEAFGTVLIEAQAMGVPCYASDVIPKATNCGGVTYLDLASGSEVWAQRIIDDYEISKGRHEDYDVSMFTEALVCENYRSLYEGKA